MYLSYYKHIKIIFQTVGKSTTELGNLNEGDYIRDIVGPLGKPTEIENFGTVVAMAGGVGTAELLPVISDLLKAGNKVITIVGARNKDLLLLQDELKANSTELLTATDDGSYGIKGFVTNVLADVIKREKVNIVYAIGPVPMMKAVSNMTREYNLKTLVSLNPIMVDGTGMCGACRVSVDKKIRFACVDGPEFDGHLVDWDELTSRLRAFKENEKTALEKIEAYIADGLDGIETKGPSDIFICGMGGELIAEIIDKCDYVKNENISLILQPMTSILELRTYLKNGLNQCIATIINTIIRHRLSKLRICVFSCNTIYSISASL